LLGSIGTVAAADYPTIYGRLTPTYTTGGAGDHLKQNKGGATYVGIKGKIPVGDELSVTYKIESGIIFSDDDRTKAYDKNNVFNLRKYVLGIGSEGLGRLFIGKTDTSVYQYGDKVLLMRDTLLRATRNEFDREPFAPRPGRSDMQSRAQLVRYDSPRINGFLVSSSVWRDDDSDRKHRRKTGHGAALNYSVDDLKLAMFFQEETKLRNSKTKGVSGRYMFGKNERFGVSGIVTQDTYDGPADDKDAWGVTGIWKIASFTNGLTYSSGKQGKLESEAVKVGSYYQFTKRFKVGASVAHYMNERTDDSNEVFAVEAVYKFSL